MKFDYIYPVIRDKRRKKASIIIKPNLEVEVRVPKRMNHYDILELILINQKQIDEILAEKAKKIEKEGLKPITDAMVQKLKIVADVDFFVRAHRYAKIMGVSIGRITIRCQKTRWGSCSGRGNVNFNCLLMLAPQEIRDYIVVHELCHRKHMNHKPEFWAEVEKYYPNYEEAQEWLRSEGNKLITRRALGKGK